MNARWDRWSRWLMPRSSPRTGAPHRDGQPLEPLPAAPFDFDRLAQGLAEGMPRREALRRLGLGLAGACLAALGLAPAAQAVTCPAGETDCFGVCRNLRTDPKHCGRCGAACNVGHLCCNGVCKNPSNDKGNCGGCGIVCAAHQFCCSGQCVNPQTDPNHCGACLQKCLPGQSCVNGVCLCPAGQVLCYGRCTDRASDENNCGGCGVRCAATQVCQGGQCRPCPSGTLFCNGAQGRTCCTSTHPTCCDGVCCVAGQFCCNNQCSVCPCDKTLCTGSQGTNCCSAGQGCEDGICCIPAGSAETCSPGDCCAGSICFGGRCVKPSGSACMSDAECERGVCTNNVCCIPAGESVTGSGQRAQCLFNGDCCAGSICDPTAYLPTRCVKPSGSACMSFLECQRNFCTNNVCCIPEGGGGCTANADCCAGLTCDPNTACRAPGIGT